MDGIESRLDVKTSGQLIRPTVYVMSVNELRVGRFVGRWVNADQPPHILRAEILDILSESDSGVAAEWAIKIADGFENLRIPEQPDLALLSHIARLTAVYGPIFPRVLTYFGGLQRITEACWYMDECYRGGYVSLGDYAEAVLSERYGDELHSLPCQLYSAIDFDNAGWSILVHNGRTHVMHAGGLIHVFEPDGNRSKSQTSWQPHNQDEV